MATLGLDGPGMGTGWKFPPVRNPYPWVRLAWVGAGFFLLTSTAATMYFDFLARSISANLLQSSDIAFPTLDSLCWQCSCVPSLTTLDSSCYCVPSSTTPDSPHCHIPSLTAPDFPHYHVSSSSVENQFSMPFFFL